MPFQIHFNLIWVLNGNFAISGILSLYGVYCPHQ